MRKTLLLPMAMLLFGATASAAPLTVEQDGAASASYELTDIGRIDLTDNTNVRVLGTDGTVLQQGLTAASLKLNFTDDVPTAVEAVVATETAAPQAKTVKQVIDGQLVIKTADGTVINTAGQRIK
ncbi:MAG: hypothetical protein IJP47_03730 [Prevotella sp.]|nr:hypothetical protein [Prevotella sp.]